MEKCDKGEQGVYYDSKLIIGVMDELRNAICSTYLSIGVIGEEIIYLATINIGEHGKNENVFDYTDYLVEKYNVVFHHQVPQYHKTNMADLGAWMTVQSKVKTYY